ncbi:MAG: hypothetical protein HYZ47_02920 [Simkania negevensis]|nr:hypothetical protein [Simkania negevensis]
MAKKNPVKKKKFFYFISTIFLLLLIALFLLPTFLSTRWGTGILTRYIDRRIGGHIEIEKLELSWLFSQKGEKIHFVSSDKIVECSLDSFKIDLSLLAFLLRSSILDRIDGALEFKNGKISIQTPSQNPIQMEEIYINLSTQKELFPLAIEGRGKTKIGQISGTFDLAGSLLSPLIFQGKGEIRHFPVEGLDRLLSLFYPSNKGICKEVFGSELNVTLNAISSSSNEPTTALQLQTPRLFAELSILSEKNRLVLTTPGKINYLITPSFTHLLSSYFLIPPPIALTKESALEISLENFSLPLQEDSLDFSHLSAKGKMVISEVNFELSEKKNPLLIKQWITSFKTNNLAKALSLQTTSQWQYLSFPPGEVGADLSLLTPLNFPFSLDQLLLALNLKVQSFPLSLVDDLRNNSPPLSDFLGKSVNLSLRSSQAELPTLTLEASSPFFSLPPSVFLFENELYLSSHTSFTYRLTPQVSSLVNTPLLIQGSLSTLKIPLKDSFGADAFEKLELKMGVKGEQYTPNNLQGMSFAGFSIDLAKEKTSPLNFNGKTQLLLAQAKEPFSLFEPTLNLKCSGAFLFTKEGEIGISPLEITLKGNKTEGALYGAMKNKVLTLQKPLTLNIAITPSLWKNIVGKSPRIPFLAQNAPLSLSINQGSFPLNRELLKQISLQGEGKIALLSLVASRSPTPFSFQDLNYKFSLDRRQEKGFFSIKGAAASLLVNFNQNSLSGFSLNLEKFPTEVLAALGQMKETLPLLIGPDLNGSLEWQKKKKGVDCKLIGKSTLLDLNGSFSIGEKVELKNAKEPFKVRWNFSDSSYKVLEKMRNKNNPSAPFPFAIQDQATLQMDVSSLSLPVQWEDGFPKVAFNLYQALFKGALSIDKLTLQQLSTKNTTRLDHLDFLVQKDTSDLTPLTGMMQAGHVEGSGTLANFITPSGAINFSKLSSQLHISVENLPSVFIDVFAHLKERSSYSPSTLLGEKVSARLETEIKESKGKIEGSLDSSSCKATFSAALDQGTLYLTQPFQAYFTISPELNALLSRNAGLEIVSTMKPISLLIRDKGFSAPLDALNIKHAFIPYAMIDLGQIQCRNTKSASLLSGLFKMKDTSSDQISFWFAPLECKLKGGQMYVDRTEILFNKNYQVALWGNIDYNKEYVKMILGLTAGALNSAFGIRGLSKDYVLTIPIEGPFGNIKIDKGAASTKIALLVTRKQIPTPKGGIWGSVLGAIGEIYDDQSNVPPAKTPFPWQK